MPGAKRICFSRCDDKVDVTAAKNPDGKVVLVVLNRGDKDTGYVLRLNGELSRTHFPAHTISTVVIEDI
jgi:glucosylceramidase